MNRKDFLSVSDLDAARLHTLLNSAIELKAAGWSTLLNEKAIALLF